jgi:hypothetical protein
MLPLRASASGAAGSLTVWAEMPKLDRVCRYMALPREMALWNCCGILFNDLCRPISM